MLEDVAASELRYGLFELGDVEALTDFAAEIFPYDYNSSRWESEISHNGVLALKAYLPSDSLATPVGMISICKTSEAIDKFADKSADRLRKWLTVPRGIRFTQEASQLAYIMHVGVIGELRNRGVARMLLEQSLELLNGRAGTPAFTHLALDVPKYNIKAIRFYETLGFATVKEFFQAYDLKDGTGSHDGLLYTKAI